MQGSALTSFNGLENLLTIGEDLHIKDNVVLTDVSALHGVTSVGEDFVVKDNTSLPTADAEALRDAIGVTNIGGTVLIIGNQ